MFSNKLKPFFSPFCHFIFENLCKKLMFLNSHDFMHLGQPLKYLIQIYYDGCSVTKWKTFNGFKQLEIQLDD